jgi:hypothetical protein
MEAAGISQTSVNVSQTTRRSDPENTRLHAGRCENVKSY